MDIEVEIAELPVERWREFRRLRIEALKTDPQAFGASYEKSLTIPESEWRERLETAALKAKKWLLFAQKDGAVVGMAGAFMDHEPEVAHVYGVYVAGAFRGKGISSAMMKTLLQRLLDQGEVRKAKLMVNQDQAAAVALYKRLGFEVTEEQEFKMGDGELHVQLFMEKKLGDPGGN